MRLISKNLTTGLVLAACAIAAGTLPSRAQATADTFKAVYDSAVAANKKAGELRNQWTVTSSSLAAAKKASDAGDFEAATKLAKEAEALANASIAQSEREKTLWKESVIK